MHFSKTYSDILLSLPSELQDNAIQYRQLKKLINKVVYELSCLGLSVPVLRKLLSTQVTQNLPGSQSPELADNGQPGLNCKLPNCHSGTPKAVYELAGDPNHIKPCLRLWIYSSSPDNPPNDLYECAKVLNSLTTRPTSEDEVASFDETSCSLVIPILAHRQEIQIVEDTTLDPHDDAHDATKSYGVNPGTQKEVVIPLISDSTFFQLLRAALLAVSTQLVKLHTDFLLALQDLSSMISSSARPVSSTSVFHPHSVVSSNPATSLSQSIFSGSKSDLYAWRQIFQLYVETEVFECMREANRGEQPIGESERRLVLFIEQLKQRGLAHGRRLRLRESRVALETFLNLNLCILHVKKFQIATSEAIRKILKKHTKRTALPIPSSTTLFNLPPSLATTPPPFDIPLLPSNSRPLSRVLVQAIGESLLPIVPHIEDYACLICTGIAFKPIRLSCGHLFCVRCLVKMQKRGNDYCPMCRAPSVLRANRSNVDWALLNFMQDWFPQETKAKLKYNEREAAEEELREMGLDPNASCLIM